MKLQTITYRKSTCVFSHPNPNQIKIEFKNKICNYQHLPAVIQEEKVSDKYYY